MNVCMVGEGAQAQLLASPFLGGDLFTREKAIINNIQ